MIKTPPQIIHHSEQLKDGAAVVVAAGTPAFAYIAELNMILTTISLLLAIGVAGIRVYHYYRAWRKEKKDVEKK